MRAIETTYAGCRFRSRLEARWAVFFDRLSMKWQYEPEGYALADGSCYLPDFWLPDDGFYVEVKGGDVALAADVDRMQRLADESGDAVIVLGDVPPAANLRWAPGHSALLPGGDPESPIAAAVFVMGAPAEGSAHRFAVISGGGPVSTQARGLMGLAPSCCIHAAYEAALSARFEHGQFGGFQPRGGA